MVDGTESGFMNVDQAVSAMDASTEPEKQEEQQTNPVEQPEQEAAPAEQDMPADPAAGDSAEVEKPNGEEDAETGEAEPPIDPPQFWSPEDREVFRNSPREVQERILKYENSRNAFATKMLEEAAGTRKAAEAERTRFSQLAEQLSTLVPQAEKTFADRWANVDWVALTDQVGAEAVQKLKFQYEAEREQVNELKRQQATAQTETIRKFQSDRMDELKTLAPEMVDEKTGPQLQREVLQYASEVLGYQPEQALRGMTAKEAVTIRKAMLWDQSQAKAKELTAKKPAVPVAKTPAASKPTAPGQARTPQQTRQTELSRKRSLTTDEAVELMNLQGNSQ